MNRIGLDTNFVLRLLVRDDPKMAEEALAFASKAEKGEISLFVPDMVVAEIVWTLTRFYKLTKDWIAKELSAFLLLPGLEMENRERILRALSWFGKGNSSFGDAYIAATLQDVGIDSLATFDRDFKLPPGLEAIRPGKYI